MFYYISPLHYWTCVVSKHPNKPNILLKSTSLHCQSSSTGLRVFTKLVGEVTWVFSTLMRHSSACKGLAERDEGRALFCIF